VTWNAINNGINETDYSFNTIAIDPKTTTTMYAGEFSNLYKSIDGGKTWNKSDSGMINPYVISLAINPYSTNIVYAGTNRGLYKSNDSGETWSKVNEIGLTNDDILCIAIDQKTPNIIYIGTDAGIFKSLNL
jgi:photosystem II stability/assembly factor-like uncharacterized protein